MATRLEPSYKGAEAVLYTVEILGKKFIVKHRLSKPYRHPDFDKFFRFTRTRAEAKVLVDLYLSGVNVPAPLFVDPDNSVIIMEYIDGVKLIEVIEELSMETLSRIFYELGRLASIMHSKRIYHGDFTLGNILITPTHKVYLIDFGLSGYSTDIEEYAIDIHLLARNLNAIVPEKKDLVMEYFWRGYREYNPELYSRVYERVKEVAMRGRYVEERLRRKISSDRYVE